MERQLSENPGGVFYTDTFQVFTETIQLEAPSTKNKPHLIMGKFIDKELGEITNTGYTKLQLLGADSILRITQIDSVTMTIVYDYVLGDISKPLTFDIYPLERDFQESDSTRFSSIPWFNKSLAHVVLEYNSEQSQTFRADGLKDFFLNMKDKVFAKEFKGFALVPADPSFAIGLRSSEFGFTIKINGYKDSIANKQSYTLIMENNPPKPPVRFTQASISEANVDLFNSTNPVAYLNDMMGIYTKISVPGINSFLNQIKGKYIVTEASFQIPSYRYYDYSASPDPNGINPGIFMYETKDGARFISGKGYKIVQREFNDSLPFINNPITENDMGILALYKENTFSTDFPFTLNLRNIEAGRLPNNPLIVAHQSTYYYSGAYYRTQSPFTYSFLKGTVPGRKIRLVVYYNKIEQ